MSTVEEMLPITSKDRGFKRGKDSLDVVGPRAVKQFCGTPIAKKVNSGKPRVVCGECVVRALRSNLRAFAKDAVASHNLHRFEEYAAGYPSEGEAFLPDFEFIHEKMERLIDAVQEAGGDFVAEQGLTDGLYDEEDVLDQVDQVYFEDMDLEDIKDVLKRARIPVVLRSKVSYTRGFGLQTHLASTSHDEDMGKEPR